MDNKIMWNIDDNIFKVTKLYKWHIGKIDFEKEEIMWGSVHILLHWTNLGRVEHNFNFRFHVCAEIKILLYLELKQVENSTSTVATSSVTRS